MLRRQARLENRRLILKPSFRVRRQWGSTTDCSGDILQHECIVYERRPLQSPLMEARNGVMCV